MSSRKSEIRFVALGAAILAAVTLALLERHHPNNAFSYRDGVDAIGLLNYAHQEGFSFSIPFFNLQTLGGFYGLNHWLSPSMWVAAAFGASQPALDATYVLCALELYLSTYLLSRILGAARTAAAAGALLLPLFILPLIWQADPFNSLLTFCTIFGDLIVANNIILIGLAMTIAPAAVNRWGYVLVFLGIAWIILLTPLATVLAIPFDLAVYSVLSVGMGAIWRRQACLFAVLLLSLAVFGPYLFGLFENTSSSLFGAELTGDIFSDPWHLLPIPFKNLSNAFWAAVIFLVFIAASRISALPAQARAFSGKILRILVTFGLMAFLFSAAFVLFAKGSATFPRPAYFEIVAWPFYFIAIGFALEAIWNWLSAPGRLPFALPHADYHVFAGFAVLASFLGLFALQRYQDRIMPYRPERDKIVQFLQAGLATKDGSYGGQVATFASTADNVGDVLAYDRAAELSAGNAHRGEMLRYFGIPTLDEYNSLIAPEKYLLLTRFFARPSDQQSRAMTVYTKVDQQALAALGVRYVVSDKPLPGPALLRTRQAIAGVGTHFVYELPGVNLGSYTPRSAQAQPSLEDQLREMFDSGFDFRTQAETAVPLPALAPAQSRLWVTPGRYRLAATSAGTSLIVLPIAYSHCFRWENDKGDNAAPQILRVDFALTGILFSHAVSGTIRPVESPFADPFCGIADWRDARSLGAHRRTLWPGGSPAPH